MFSDWFCSLMGKAFAALPTEAVWEWAQRTVFIKKMHGAEGGYYRASKTPWTKWLQEIARNPWRMRKGKRTRIRRVRIKKSTQSGFTEAILNIIRWCAKFCPRNVIYSINSKEEVSNIRERLVDTLGDLGEEVFRAETEADDLPKYTLRLREMIIWFLGSFSAGSFANKYAPLVIGDELDDHGTFEGDATTLDLLEERLKTADEDGLSIALGKPKLKGGPIDKAHAEGDQYEWMTPCPHCGAYQLFTHDRLRFSHCKDLLGHWDYERILRETYYECVSGCHIENYLSEDGQLMPLGQKEAMQEAGRWWLVKFGDPETVSLHFDDIHSLHKGSTYGHLALEYVKACAAAEKGNFKPLQAYWNGRKGEGFEQRAERWDLTDIMKCRSAYRRGIIPRAGLLLILGYDVGLFRNTRWTVLALNPTSYEAWIIDWGNAITPEDMLPLLEQKYECPTTGLKQGILFAFIDSRYKQQDVFAVCLTQPRRIYPTLGNPRHVSTRSLAMVPVPHTRPGFGVITYLDDDAKTELYIDRIKERRPPLLHFPEDADERYMREFCGDYMITDPVTNRSSWAPKPRGPNHGGDTVKIALTGYDFITDGPRSRLANGENAETGKLRAALEKIAADLKLHTTLTQMQADLKNRAAPGEAFDSAAAQ